MKKKIIIIILCLIVGCASAAFVIPQSRDAIINLFKDAPVAGSEDTDKKTNTATVLFKLTSENDYTWDGDIDFGYDTVTEAMSIEDVKLLVKGVVTIDGEDISFTQTADCVTKEFLGSDELQGLMFGFTLDIFDDETTQLTFGLGYLDGFCAGVLDSQGLDDMDYTVTFKSIEIKISGES